jgi:acyl carrier protein
VGALYGSIFVDGKAGGVLFYTAEKLFVDPPPMNNAENILVEVREVFKTSFNIDPQTVTMETKASDIPGWDSVGHLSLASNLEQTFKISLDVDEMMEMENVREILRIVQGKLAKGA